MLTCEPQVQNFNGYLWCPEKPLPQRNVQVTAQVLILNFVLFHLRKQKRRYLHVAQQNKMTSEQAEPILDSGR